MRKPSMTMAMSLATSATQIMRSNVYKCQSQNIIRKGTKERLFRSLPSRAKKTIRRLTTQRTQCRDCRALRWLKPDFARDQNRHTKTFSRYVLELLRVMNSNDVAKHLGISWTFTKDIQKASLQKQYGRPKLAHVRYLAIDEVCIGKGHRYLTIVLDPETGVVLLVGDGKGKDALIPFWKRPKRCGAQIEAVAIDMSRAYLAAVSDNLPDAVIVFDHFHVVKLMNDKLTKLRRELYREATDQLAKDVLKGTRWLRLKNSENLDEMKNENERLSEALKLNEPLALGDYLKEEMRQIWCQLDKGAAQRLLTDWAGRALASGVRVWQELGRSIQVHAGGILSWYDYPLTTTALAGTNTKVQLIQRQRYGLRDQAFLKLKIYACKAVRYRLVG